MEFSISTFTYLAQHEDDYSNPIFTADCGWVHLEARYNYEELRTGSFWFGYNFSLGKKLEFDITPMVGGVFGNITGIAPGYTITVRYERFEFSTQGEYFLDAGTSSNNFFYCWSELSASIFDSFRLGAAVQRTQAGSNSDVQCGPLIGFTYKDVDLATYWLGLPSGEAKFIFAVTVNF